MSPCLNLEINPISISLSQKHLYAKGKKSSFRRFNSPEFKPTRSGIAEMKAARKQAIWSDMFKNHLWPFCFPSRFITQSMIWNITEVAPSVAPNLGISVRNYLKSFDRLRSWMMLMRNLINPARTKFLMNGPKHQVMHSANEASSQQATLYRLFSSTWYVFSFKPLTR